LQGWLNYRAGEQKFETAVRSVAETHLPLLSVAIWDIEPQTIEKQMGLLLNSPDVAWVAIYTSTGKVFTQGSKENVSQSQTLRMDIPAPMASNGSVGTLELVLDKSSLRSELIRNLIIAVLEILVLALVLLFAVAKILKRDLEQPLHELAAYVRKLEANQLGAVFSLHRRKRHGYNEIDLVVDGFREMQSSLQRHIRDQDQLVLERTQQLETALATLKTLSNTDALTQVFNRQYFNEQMPAELTARCATDVRCRCFATLISLNK
jgi:methyl-accepting chemotaxis protein